MTTNDVILIDLLTLLYFCMAFKILVFNLNSSSMDIQEVVDLIIKEGALSDYKTVNQSRLTNNITVKVERKR